MKYNIYYYLLSHINITFWSTLVHFRSISIHFSLFVPLQSIMFGPIWSNSIHLVHFSVIWSTSIHSVMLWDRDLCGKRSCFVESHQHSILIYFDLLWSIFGLFQSICSTSIHSVWSNSIHLVHFSVIWSTSIHLVMLWDRDLCGKRSCFIESFVTLSM